MTQRVKGLAALVVGGGSGIGEACAQLFAAEGGRVLIADLNQDGAERVAARIRKAGGTAFAAAMNVSVQKDIDRVVAEAQRQLGGLDVLINASAMLKPAKLEVCSIDEWASCFGVNVEGALMIARSCLPLLRKSASASIVNIGSLSAMWGRPNGASYGPSKAALVSLSRQMALEWAPAVRVNVVNPGSIDTALARAAVGQEVLDARAKVIPAGRIGSPAEVAELVVFLASPVASYVTAQAINCDGGFSETLMSAPMGKN